MIITVPISYYTVNLYGSRTDSKGHTKNGLGQVGIWLGFVFGSVHQVAALLFFLVFRTDWV